MARETHSPPKKCMSMSNHQMVQYQWKKKMARKFNRKIKTISQAKVFSNVFCMLIPYPKIRHEADFVRVIRV